MLVFQDETNIVPKDEKGEKIFLTKIIKNPQIKCIIRFNDREGFTNTGLIEQIRSKTILSIDKSKANL